MLKLFRITREDTCETLIIQSVCHQWAADQVARFLNRDSKQPHCARAIKGLSPEIERFCLNGTLNVEVEIAN